MNRLLRVVGVLSLGLWMSCEHDEDYPNETEEFSVVTNAVSSCGPYYEANKDDLYDRCDQCCEDRNWECNAKYNPDKGWGCKCQCMAPDQKEICGNGIDDDGDGLVDAADPECGRVEICGNGIDDDLNGYTDCEDTQCKCTGPDEEGDCKNGIDDDRDGRTDMEDPDCRTGIGEPNCTIGINEDCPIKCIVCNRVPWR